MDDELSRGFAALADPTRRDPRARLALGDATVTELAEPFDATVQNISTHSGPARCRAREQEEGRTTPTDSFRGRGL